MFKAASRLIDNVKILKFLLSSPYRHYARRMFNVHNIFSARSSPLSCWFRSKIVCEVDAQFLEDNRTLFEKIPVYHQNIFLSNPLHARFSCFNLLRYGGATNEPLSSASRSSSALAISAVKLPIHAGKESPAHTREQTNWKIFCLIYAFH